MFRHWPGLQVYVSGIELLVGEGMPRKDAEKKALNTLLEKTTIFSPEHLLAANVSTYRCTQHAGEFVITFPRAYHSGLCNGFNMGEAVNFALRDWAPFGADCAMRMRYMQRLQVCPLKDRILSEASAGWRLGLCLQVVYSLKVYSGKWSNDTFLGRREERVPPLASTMYMYR